MIELRGSGDRATRLEGIELRDQEIELRDQEIELYEIRKV